MVRRDKIGITVLIGIAVLLLFALVWTLRGGEANYDWETNLFVKQRVINLQKGK